MSFKKVTYYLLITSFAALTLISCGGGKGYIEVKLFEISNMVFSQKAVITASTLNQLDSVSYSIETKPGNLSAPINVTYSIGYLEEHNLVDHNLKTINLTVFGLYADYNNIVKIEFHYSHGAVLGQEIVATTAAFISDSALPAITVNLINEQTPVNFILVRSSPRSPVIIDADGETRWIAPDVGEPARATFFDGDSFIVGASNSDALYRINWDGSFDTHQIGGGVYTKSHHNIELGKVGYLNTIGYDDGVIARPESIVIETSGTGEVLRQWDLDEIVAGFITENGEDPSTFVRNDFDWCHMNSVIYDAANDDIVISCREDFVISIDYSTSEINWLLGNTDKLWFTNFPNSLQKLALALDVSGIPPIGQHSLSMSDDGQRLMLFNNGKGNFVHPYIGDDRSYSLVSIFEIDKAMGTAQAIWEFENNQQIYSDICSSAYRTRSGDILINYATSELRTIAHIMVVNDAQQILYDATIPKRVVDLHSCVTAYNIEEIPLDNLSI